MRRTRGGTESAAISSLSRRLVGRDVALLRRPPGRRGGNREIDRAADVVRGAHLPAGAREPPLVAKQDPRERQVRLEEPRPVDHGEHAVELGHLSGSRERPLEPNVRQLTCSEDSVHLDRVADPQPLPQPIRLVVGELVDHRERPHLEGEQARVPALRPREEHRQRERAGRGRGDRHPGRDPQAATGQRDDEGRRKRRRGRRPDHGPQRRGPSTARDPEAQGAASVYAAPPDRRRAGFRMPSTPPC